MHAEQDCWDFRNQDIFPVFIFFAWDYSKVSSVYRIVIINGNFFRNEYKNKSMGYFKQ